MRKKIGIIIHENDVRNYALINKQTYQNMYSTHDSTVPDIYREVNNIKEPIRGIRF